MASVVLSIAGGAIAGPIGAALGSLAGAAIDSAIVSALTPNQKIEGARLDDIGFTTSTEGAAIPRVAGTMRLGGNIIWATDFREEKKTETQGGKGGGGGVETTEYTYYCSFAVAICEGPITSIGRIWADGKELSLKNLTYRIYLGDENQEPDPFIEAKEGAGNAPAYRGVAYIVFEELALTSFGNRIPQLSFEVLRLLDDPNAAEQAIRAVTLIPGAGEYVYSTQKVLTKPAQIEGGAWKITGEDVTAENVHTSAGSADIKVALDRLEEVCPNIESVSLVVAWFGSDLRAGNCEIRPKVETKSKISTQPGGWVVDGVTRLDADAVSTIVGTSDIAYGGTPADWAVVEAIKEIKARGWRVTFYPFIMMDIAADNTLPDPYSDNAGTIGQPAYPWRGRITCSPAPGYAGTPDKTASAGTQITDFLGTAQASDFTVSGETVSWNGAAGEWGYRRMCLHYALLCQAAGGVDSFLIASEMRGLSQVRSSGGSNPTFPFVDGLRALAGDCRAVLGAGTDISYAADWSEYFGYHPNDGTGDVFFHLDPLWADGDIDFIGIDNYMPLSDWRNGNSHLDALAGWRSIYDQDYLESNIEGGEGYDWYYASDADRDAQVRTPITDSTYGKPWVFRYKDVRNWWLNQHYNRPGGVESGSPTAWVPQSKPFRFTEAGCPAVDKGTNQPNVFVDPKSSESFYPYFSNKNRDDLIQRRYIEATYAYWNANGGGMIDMGELAIWTWDARPYPYFPALSDIWGDAENWRLGHWLSGRLGAASLGSLVREICLRGGIAESLIDVSELSAVVPGHLIAQLDSARGSLQPLMRFYTFDATESDGIIQFVPRGLAPVATIGADDLVAAGNPQDDDYELTRAQETELPLALKWRLKEAGSEYNDLTVEVRRITVSSARIAGEQFPLATSSSDADMRARRVLYDIWTGREKANFRLPPSKLAFDPTDIIDFEVDGRALELRLAQIGDDDARTVEGERTDQAIYGARPAPERTPKVPTPAIYGPPVTAFMDLPIINEDIPAYRPWLALYASPWYGTAAVYRSPTEDGFVLLDTTTLPAQMGVLAFDFYSSGTAARNFDLANELYVDVYSGTLTSASDIDVFAGANAVAIESASGVWEIVQFANAELQQPGRYKLTRLLRGLLGTEGAMGNPAPAGSRCVILDTSIRPLSIAQTDVGLAYNWRVGPASEAVDDDDYAQISFTPGAVGLRPYAPCHVEQPYRHPHTPGDYTIKWKRRSRAPSADSWDVLEVPLYEASEAYEVDIMNGSAVIRTLSASGAPQALYSEADQIADWGAPLAQGDQLAIVIYQISETYGRSTPRAETLFF